MDYLKRVFIVGILLTALCSGILESFFMLLAF
jgi:hypothetical protein